MNNTNQKLHNSFLIFIVKFFDLQSPKLLSARTTNQNPMSSIDVMDFYIEHQKRIKTPPSRMFESFYSID